MRPNPVSTWHDYYQAMLGKPVHPLYQSAEQYLPNSGDALEIGAGTGQGARFLLDRGLSLTAIDASPESVEILRSQVPEADVLLADIESYSIPCDHFDVIAAGYVLFLVSTDRFEVVWQGIADALKSGGLFIGQFIGERDDWASKGYSTQSRDEVTRLLSGFELLHLEEVERDGTTAQGSPKHWHVFHVLARKS